MDKQTLPLLSSFSKDALITEKQYHELYKRSLDDPERFWGEQAEQYITWFESWEKVLSGGFDKMDVHWFQGGKLMLLITVSIGI